MFHSLSRVVAGSLLCLAGVSLGCGDSLTSPSAPMTPAPMAMPVGFGVSSVFPTSGPTIGGNSIRISGRAFQAGATVLLDGVAAQVTKVTETTIEARTLGHAAGPVDVAVMNPDGQSGLLPAAYTFGEFSVAGSPPLVAPNAELTVRWVAPSGRGCSGGGDWLAMYRVGDPDQTGAANGHSDLWYDHVCGGTSGTWKLQAPAVPGVYEFRFMVEDFSVARSDPITVR